VFKKIYLKRRGFRGFYAKDLKSSSCRFSIRGFNLTNNIQYLFSSGIKNLTRQRYVAYLPWKRYKTDEFRKQYKEARVKVNNKISKERAL